MVEVLGKETANEAVINAWAEAYGFLADVLIARESAIYKELESQPHGWIGKRQFTVTRKIRKSDFICSLSLRPTDGLPLPPHRAGQYTTVYPGDSMDAAIPRPIAPRNYSISSPPGSAEWRITIKREVGADGKPNGLYSNWIHDHVKEGDVLNLGPAVGNFFLDEAALKKRPAIFLGAGVGLTPLLPMAMIATRVAPEQKIWWFYSASNSDYHPLVEQEIEEKALMNPNIKTVVACLYPESMDP